MLFHAIFRSATITSPWWASSQLRPNFLLPTQFGVGTKGGVELIIHAVNLPKR
jgi:hypothetical protein